MGEVRGSDTTRIAPYHHPPRHSSSLWETPPVVAPETRVEINTPGGGDLTSFALSPDGRQIVFLASRDGPARLWLRSLNATMAQPLTGADGAAYPFWSPDSRSIAFFADGQLKERLAHWLRST